MFLTVLFSLCFNAIAQSEGEQIFKTTCISCHNLPGGGKLIGPDLKDVLTHDRFVNEEDPVRTLIKYVQNPSDFGVTLMASQPLDADEIKSVLEFINTYVPEEIEEITTEEVETEQGMSSNPMLIIAVIILFILNGIPIIGSIIVLCVIYYTKVGQSITKEVQDLMKGN